MSKPKNTLSDLRDHLFDSIERVISLNDPNTDANEKMQIDQAKAICNLSKNIIDSAKVEIQALQIISKAENPNATEHFKSKMTFLKETNE